MLEDFYFIECLFSNYCGQVSLVVISDDTMIEEIVEIAKVCGFGNAIIPPEELEDYTGNFDVEAIIEGHKMLVFAMPEYEGFLKILTRHEIIDDYYAQEIMETYPDYVC